MIPIDKTARLSLPRVPAGPVRFVDKISSQALFGGNDEVRIAHRGRIYRLRCTPNGQLVLKSC